MVPTEFSFPASKWFYELFSLDEELNIPAWYSAFSLLFCSGLLKAITAINSKSLFLWLENLIFYIYIFEFG